MNEPLHRSPKKKHFDVRSWSKNRQLATGGGALLFVAIVVAALVVGLGGNSSPPGAGKSGTTTVAGGTGTGTTSNGGTTGTDGAKSSKICPLTGLPAPGGVVPQRMALAVKIGNDPNARPQSGLGHADIVIDTLAEGGIVRYIALFQCGTASAIGPVRSVRWTDWHILQQLGHVGLAFVHGINPDVNTVQSLPWICDLDEFSHGNAYYDNNSRVPPEATYTSTSALWANCPKSGPPPPMFTYSATAPAGGSPVSQVELVYNAYESDIVWQWSQARHVWLHAYRENGAVVPDLNTSNVQLSATNVVIEEVNITVGPYPESPGGPGDQEAQTVGSGQGWILRDGRAYPITWERPALSDVTRYIGANGKQIPLQPGNTWLELYPTSPTAPAPVFTK